MCSFWLNESLGNIVSFNGSTDGIKILKGDKTITFSQKNVTNFAQIVFDKKFSKLPSVQLTVNDLGMPNKVSIGVQNLTASGFVITGINTVDTDSVNVQWLAIGI
ncbi:MAG: H-type lectin domain-containing protein [Roseburia sp.]|nr:H-type lectin domain-containing protein [Roseburia sp.]